MATPKPKATMAYTMVKFKNPERRGMTWHVSIFKTRMSKKENGMWMVAEVTESQEGVFPVYTVGEFKKRVPAGEDWPQELIKEMYKKAEAYCKKHGFINRDPRWK